MNQSQPIKRLIRTAVWVPSKGGVLPSRTMTPRCYHSSRFVRKSSEEQSKELHQQMKQVMGAKRAPTNEMEDKARKARVRQSAINVGVSFMTVVLAGQALKSGSERRKMEKKMYEATEEMDKKIRVLKHLSSEGVIRGLAQKVSSEMSPSSSQDGSGWFRRQSSSNDAKDGEQSTEERVFQVLWTELSLLIGDANQSAAERDRLNLEKLQQEEMALAAQLLQEQFNNSSNDEVRVDRDGETVIKKRVLRM